jgi:GPH family glycoside/pentoside/hexuronide:cation symporter
MSPSSSVRTTLSTYRFVCAFGGGVLVASLVTPLKNLLGGGNELAGFQWTMAIFAVVSIAMFLFTFSATRERVAPVGDENANFKRDLGNLLRNRAWVVLFFAAIFTLTNVGVRGAVMIYYMKYYITDDGARVFLFMDKSALFLSSGMWAMILGVACTKWFTARWGKKQLMIVLCTVNALSMGVLFFFPPGMFWWVFVINFVGTVLNGPTPALVWAMYADAADYGEWKFNRRTTALNFSAAQFGQKMGLAIGGATAGWCLAWFGFVANTAQNDETLLGIRLLFAIAPAGFALLNVIALCFYPLHEGMVKQMERELAARKGEPAPA